MNGGGRGASGDVPTAVPDDKEWQGVVSARDAAGSQVRDVEIMHAAG